MAKAGLREALTTITSQALDRVSDKIVRVEVSKDWPIAQALAALNKKTPLRVLATRPFAPSQFQGLEVTKDAGVATAWRNKKRRPFAVVIVGSTSGNLDAGLKDVRTVNRRSFVDHWRDSVLSNLTEHNDLNKIEVTRLLGELFSFVADGTIPALALETYIASILSDPRVETICSDLWKVGLLTDPRVLDRAMAIPRLRRNQELVETLRTSDDPRIDRLLEDAESGTDATKKKVALKAIAYREKAESKDLAKIDLPTLEDILRVTTTAQSRSMGILELLNAHHQQPEQVRDCLRKLADEWRLDEVREFIEEEFAAVEGKHTVRVELSPATSESATDDDEIVLAHPWTGEDDETRAVLAALSESGDPESLGQGQKPFFANELVAAGHASAEVTKYLKARADLRAYEPWLDRDGLWLLLLHTEARM